MDEKELPVSGPALEGLALETPMLPDFYGTAPIGLCHWDLNLRFVHINEWLANLNGLAVSEHLGRTMSELRPDNPEMAQAVEAQVLRVIETGELLEPGTIELRIQAQGGIMKTLERAYFPVKSPNGTLVGVSCAVQDVTERAAATKKLEWFSAMVTASSDLMVLVDATYTYRAVNQAYCEAHGRTREDILDHTVADVFGNEVFETTLKPHLDRALAGEHVTFTFWWDSPHQGRRHVDARYDPFIEADGSVSAVAVDARDTTDERRFGEELEHSVLALEAANQELQAFSDALAHDLRNPSLIVTNFSHQLREVLDHSLGPQEKADLQRIQDAGRHMLHIIDDLRDLGDVNRAEINRWEIDLSAMGADIIGELRALAPDRDVTFEAKDRIKAHGDKTLLRVLLTNLLQNAWKYSKTTGHARIELGVTETDGHVAVYHVRDNGIGFDNVSKDLIFEPFERLHTRTDYAGSGLGLATVQRIVQRHGGRVWGEGEPGQGAVFRFTLEEGKDE